jgi:hypothetical protein
MAPRRCRQTRRPDNVYGRWTPLDQQQTYPSAKRIQGAEVVDLLYDNEERIRVGRIAQKSIVHARQHLVGLRGGAQVRLGKRERAAMWSATPGAVSANA